MTGPKGLAILLESEVVATLERTASTLRITYRDDAPGSTPLSLSLPRGVRHSGTAVTRFLNGLVPEDANARAAIARQYRIDPSDLMGLLHAIGKDCAGAVQFCLDSEVEELQSRAGELEPCSNSDIEARLAALDMNEAASWTMPEEHWSLGGTQQKFALRRQGDLWFTAHGAAATSHIIKPGIRRMALQALSEHATMAGAARIGIPTATTSYQEFRSQSAIVVERFDRRPTPGGDLVRVHQEDLCQATGNPEKYEDQGGPSAGDIARALREFAATAAEAERAVRLFTDMVIFNTVVGAPDAHARNYAVLLAGDSLALAPMYDAATAAAYGRSDGSSAHVAMATGSTRALDHLTAKDWSTFARALRLDADYVTARVTHFAEQAPQAIIDVLEEIGTPEADELRSRASEPLMRTAQRIVTALR
ncbi:HipA domain-containing protein [Demequina sp.]|uniref:HipA domain-containing protein n=1 Tax=Demequina sp. TaxID=2050685 RepID=UPI003D0B9132